MKSRLACHPKSRRPIDSKKLHKIQPGKRGINKMKQFQVQVFSLNVEGNNVLKLIGGGSEKVGLVARCRVSPGSLYFDYSTHKITSILCQEKVCFVGAVMVIVHYISFF